MSVEVRREELGVWRDGVDGRGEVIVDMVSFGEWGRTVAEGLGWCGEEMDQWDGRGG